MLIILKGVNLLPREGMPQWANEVGELGDFKDEPICQSWSHGWEEDERIVYTSNQVEDDATNVKEKIKEFALL